MRGIGEAALYLLLFGLVVSLAYLVPRLLGQGFGGVARGRRIRVVEVLPVGRDRALILVEVAGQYLLIGSGPQGLTCLATFADPDAIARLEAEPGPGSPGPGPGGRSPGTDPFRRVLERFFQKGHE
ncbi:MAG: flagellar biosynthetic protein FliO [Firmicutes bacterium]|nr:flagellar biosynthetic protein FliO [Bacillota bacterium]